jgi:chorismate--pyruvate lyase
MHHASLSRRSAFWRPAARISRVAVPEHYAPWLFDTSSLTERVTAVCTAGFRVRVLTQVWDRPFADEIAALDAAPHCSALIRQVQLMCGEHAWVFARTVIPRTTLVGRNRRLAHLGSRPLGAALFSDPTMERGEVQIACLGARDTLFAHAVLDVPTVPQEIWGRRSVFRVGGKPLLVSEIFLPGIARAP